MLKFIISSIPIQNHRVHSTFSLFTFVTSISSMEQFSSLILRICTYLKSPSVCKKSPMPSRSHVITYALLTLLSPETPARLPLAPETGPVTPPRTHPSC